MAGTPMWMFDKALAAIMMVVAMVSGRLDALNKRLGSELLETLEYVPEFGIDKKIRPAARGLGKADPGQLGLGTILAAFVVVIAGMVVLTVVDQFDQSLDTPSSSALSTAEGDILSGFADMASLIGPLLLIGIGIVIIGLIRRVQAG